MSAYIVRRLVLMVPTLLFISIVSFILIELPPGDYLSTYVASLQAEGTHVSEELLEGLRRQYGLDQPAYVRYARWMWGIFTRGDFGYSFGWSRPVRQLIGGRIFMTMVISIGSLLFAWAIALPVGIYSAVKQYSVTDYVFTFLGFIGLATPNFLLAIIFMYIASQYFGTAAGGLFSPEFADAPWSFARFLDFLRHLILPLVIVGTAGTASLIRITRANLLDELGKPYVEAAMARGLSKTRRVLKYPVRVALNPFVSSIGFVLPAIVSGEVIVAVVLNLPTTGPLLLGALLTQDMYLAGSFVLILSVLTVIGVLISDILLAWLDPRIRYD